MSLLHQPQRQLPHQPPHNAKRPHRPRHISQRRNNEVGSLGIKRPLDIARRRRILPARMRMVDPQMLKPLPTRAPKKCKQLSSLDLISSSASQQIARRQNRRDHPVAPPQQPATLNLRQAPSLRHQLLRQRSPHQNNFVETLHHEPSVYLDCGSGSVNSPRAQMQCLPWKRPVRHGPRPKWRASFREDFSGIERMPSHPDTCTGGSGSIR